MDLQHNLYKYILYLFPAVFHEKIEKGDGRVNLTVPDGDKEKEMECRVQEQHSIPTHNQGVTI